jgi:hypothetical protein
MESALRGIIILFATFAASTAWAQSRPSTTNMSCAAAASLVQQRGAVVLGTGGSTFDRFVRDASFCPHGQILRAAFVPAADQRQCFIGWRCHEPEYQVR